MNCRICGQTAIEASERGAYLKRVNEYGAKGIWQCEPNCQGKQGGQEDALIRAIEDGDQDKGDV